MDDTELRSDAGAHGSPATGADPVPVRAPRIRWSRRHKGLFAGAVVLGFVLVGVW
jgi:hypothetical protein